jgi:hypothetical protein
MSLLATLARVIPGIASPEVDLSTLPDLRLSTNERAWSTLWYIEGHPREWEQRTYGRFTDHTRQATVGCFAHHLVKAAGYEQFGCSVSAVHGDVPWACPRLGQHGCLQADRVRTETGWRPVSVVAMELLNVSRADNGTHLAARLFSGGNSLRNLRKILPELVGKEPRNRW